MSTKYISLIQLKGGVGKTTLAICIGAYLAHQGKKVLIMDADMPQGTASAWGSILEYPNLDFSTALTMQEMMHDLQSRDGQYDYIVIDSPPRMAEMQRSIMMLSDYVFIPLAASAPDVWAFDDLKKILDEAVEKGCTAQMRIIWNTFQKYPSNIEMRQAVLDNFGILEFENHLSSLTAYSKMIAVGKHPLNFGNYRAKKQFTALANEIVNLIKG